MLKKLVILVAVALLVWAVYSYFNPGSINEDQKETVSQEEFQQDAATASAYVDISPEGASDLIKELPDVIILDVSSAYDQGHLPGAINYYVGDGSLEEAIPTLDKEATYLVYCHVEAASRQGAQMLIDAGINSVYRLSGEYGAWVDAGLEVEE